jgi:hypothetical protein
MQNSNYFLTSLKFLDNNELRFAAIFFRENLLQLFQLAEKGF